ncbi:metallophosphoesterase [Desertihabitans aurantiacus]|uniref:metallophosphoesterase n=1 Tax=Desertihabitans aurantiacus TaxID=2282477 RepID=UPI00130081DA|nr:metallophosphoesterase [Desertihabitans aurantiacus]
MQIAILGDVHGCVRHAATVVGALGVDVAIQVGDLGAYPSIDALPDGDRAFVDAYPEQRDVFALVDGELQVDAGAPTYFVSGNHDSRDWLCSLHTIGPVAPIDPGGAFWHVQCGTTMEVGGRRFGFLGGIEEPAAGHDLDLAAAARLDRVDVLITHDGPYGLATWEGRTQGSPKLTRVIDDLQPLLHLHGHYHHRNGPRRYGRTTSYGLAQLIPPGRRGRTRTVAEGSVGIVDTASLTFDYVAPERIGAV